MASEEELSTLLSEFARTLLTDFSVQTILDHLVRRIVDILPIDGAGVSLISSTTLPRLVAGSDPWATRYEHLQTALGQGPCIAAYVTDQPIAIPNLAEDDRFPVYAEKALAQGLVAVFTFPLRNDGRTLGALDLYRKTPGPLDDRDMVVAQTLTDVVTAYLLNAQARYTNNEFVAETSHELQAPMTSIVGFVELLLAGDAGPLSEAQEEFIRKIHHNAGRVSALTKDLLTLSTLEYDGPHHQHVPVDLCEVIAVVRATLQPAIAARELNVTFTTPAEPVLVRGNDSELESLAMNLMSNAMKYTNDGGRVACTLTIAADQARLEVSDNGIGIPVNEQSELFSRFFRSSTAVARAIEGTGLGLIVVHNIVKSHGG